MRAFFLISGDGYMKIARESAESLYAREIIVVGDESMIINREAHALDHQNLEFVQKTWDHHMGCE